MRFSDKLKGLMTEQGLTQTQLSELTGYKRPSICQWLSGSSEPSAEKKQRLAVTLGMPSDYFNQFEAEPEPNEVVNVPIVLVARLMGKSRDWVAKGLQDGIFPWGYAVKMTDWSYWVSSAKFTECTGIKVPMNQI